MGLLLRGRRGEERKGIEGEWTEGREEEAGRVMSGLFPEFSLSTTHALVSRSRARHGCVFDHHFFYPPRPLVVEVIVARYST